MYKINQMKFSNLKSFGLLKVRRGSHGKLIRFVDGWQQHWKASGQWRAGVIKVAGKTTAAAVT
jgi:hypothetical protein